MKKVLLHSLLAGLLFSFGPVGLPGAAQAEEWGDPYDVLLTRPDVEVQTSQDDDGVDRRRFDTPAGVIVIQSRKNGEVETQVTDKSGLGAIYCIHGLLVDMKITLDFCEIGDQDPLSPQLTNGIERLDTFILENNIPPIDAAKLDAAYKARVAKYTTQLEQRVTDSGKTKEAFCRPLQSTEINDIEGNSMAGIFYHFRTMKQPSFMDMIEKTVSVPRIPTVHPCF